MADLADINDLPEGHTIGVYWGTRNGRLVPVYWEYRDSEHGVSIEDGVWMETGDRNAHGQELIGTITGQKVVNNPPPTIAAKIIQAVNKVVNKDDRR